MNRKKILLLGATGMAGHVTYLYLKETGKYDVIPVVYRNKFTEDSIIIDVRNKEQIEELVRFLRPDVVINCIGVLVENANKYPDEAILLNSYLPHLLAKVSDEVEAKLIHISTDCVFSGKAGSYKEDDFRDADDVYGRSKALGEINSKNHLTLRTSIIGPEIKSDGTGLFHWFMQQSGKIKGFTSAYWGGITTVELAKAIDKAILNNLTGILHVTNGDKISKYSLISLFKAIWNKTEVEIAEFEGKYSDKSLVKSEHFDFEIPNYQEMLLNQKVWMNTHNSIYNKVY